MGAVAAVGNPQLPPQFLIANRNQFDSSSEYLILGEARTYERNTQTGGYEALDHADARKLHPDLQMRSIWTKQLIHNAPAVPGFWQQQWLLGHLTHRHHIKLGQGVLRTYHQHQLIAKN